MPQKRLIFAVSLGLVIAGCTISPVENNEQPLLSQDGPEIWHATGRFAYVAEEDSQTGQFDWRQRGSDYQVRLFGPLGIGSVRIVGSASAVEIQSGDETYVSSQPDQLLFELTGMHIPISALSQWMTGRIDAQGTNQNWQIRYDDYQNVEEFLLPTRIDIEQNLTSMRIAVAEWTLGHVD